MAAPKSDVRDVVEESEIRVKAHRWCKDSIGGVWSKISSDEMAMEPVRNRKKRSKRGTIEAGGMSNYLYLCRLPNGISPVRGEPHQVLLRIYGHITTSNMDVLVHNSVVFALLAEKRLGPKPYGMFFDGRIEEFIVARPLKHYDLSRPEIMELVAERLATFHSLDMPLCKKPRWIFSVIKRWITEIQNNFSVHSNNKTRAESETILRLQAIDMEKECDILMFSPACGPIFQDKAFHKQEIWPLAHGPYVMASEHRSILSGMHSPVVFCHNDLQEGNILFNAAETDPEKRMTIIDWEYGNYNYRGFDLANHFCEWAICYDEESFYIEPEKYPSRQQQYTFFRHYLKACGQETVTEADLQQMYAETNTFALASHFLWATWAAIQGHSSSIDFCYWDYAVSRFEQYFKLKEELPSMLAAGL